MSINFPSKIPFRSKQLLCNLKCNLHLPQNSSPIIPCVPVPRALSHQRLSKQLEKLALKSHHTRLSHLSSTTSKPLPNICSLCVKFAYLNFLTTTSSSGLPSGMLQNISDPFPSIVLQLVPGANRRQFKKSHPFSPLPATLYSLTHSQLDPNHTFSR